MLWKEIDHNLLIDSKNKFTLSFDLFCLYHREANEFIRSMHMKRVGSNLIVFRSIFFYFLHFRFLFLSFIFLSFRFFSTELRMSLGLKESIQLTRNIIHHNGIGGSTLVDTLYL